jgi:hypothetical protein
MSLATLKKKSQAKYRNSSVGTGIFSINGVHRNQGYVGQGSDGRSLSRALSGYTGELKGHGGCCGKFDVKPPLQSGIVQNEHLGGGLRKVKTSVLSSRGMLAKRNAWLNRTYLDEKKAVGPQYDTSEGAYLDILKKRLLKELEVCKSTRTEDNVQRHCKDVSRHCTNIVQDEDVTPHVKSQSEYLAERRKECIDIVNGFYRKLKGGTGIVCGSGSSSSS